MYRLLPCALIFLLASGCGDPPGDVVLDDLFDDDDDDDAVSGDDDDSAGDDDDSAGDDDDVAPDDDDVAPDDDDVAPDDDDDSGDDDDSAAPWDCTGPVVTWSGDVTVQDPTYDVEDVCAGGFNHVTGDVSLSLWTGASLSALDCLCTIDGDLTLFNNALSDGDGLNNLQLVGGDLTVSGNPSLADLDGFAALAEVTGDLVISNNVALQSLGFGALAAVGGDFTIAWNASLPTAEAEALRDSVGAANIAGNVTIIGNAP